MAPVMADRRRRDLERQLRKLGWTLAGLTGGGHLRITKTGRPDVIAAATPSCRRARRNMLAMLRRADRAAHSTLTANTR
jgi:hypothetical protein